MSVERRDSMELRTQESIVWFRQKVRRWAVDAGFSLVDQTKLVTAASELARNTVDHGRGGVAHIEIIRNEERRGLRLILEDEGPGIHDVEQALSDGYSTTGGLGMGLGGSKRLLNEFEIETAPGQGTRIVAVKWK